MLGGCTSLAGPVPGPVKLSCSLSRESSPISLIAESVALPLSGCLDDSDLARRLRHSHHFVRSFAWRAISPHGAAIRGGGALVRRAARRLDRSGVPCDTGHWTGDRRRRARLDARR